MKPFILWSSSPYFSARNGHTLDDEFRNTKVMTFIIEFKVAEERMLEVIEAPRRASEEIDTVMSFDLIVECDRDGGIPIKHILDMEGIGYYINGKTNVRLLRPPHDFNSG